eukprot:jgi/Botrbrau1/18756/Bobra.0386s0079.1
MVYLEADRFLNELGKLYEKAKDKGSVNLVFKRSNLKSRKSRHPDPEAEYKCLVRASDGKKKISTAVPEKEQFRFQDSLLTILKAHLDGLKKKEKAKPKPKK